MKEFLENLSIGWYLLAAMFLYLSVFAHKAKRIITKFIEEE